MHCQADWQMPLTNGKKILLWLIISIKTNFFSAFVSEIEYKPNYK